MIDGKLTTGYIMYGCPSRQAVENRLVEFRDRPLMDYVPLEVPEDQSWDPFESLDSMAEVEAHLYKIGLHNSYAEELLATMGPYAFNVVTAPAVVRATIASRILGEYEKVKNDGTT